MKHVAGTSVILNNDHVIQRCLICGFALIDQRYSETVVEDGHVGEVIPDFGFGAVIEVTGPPDMQRMQKEGQMVDFNYVLNDQDVKNLKGQIIYHKVDDISSLCRRD